MTGRYSAPVHAVVLALASRARGNANRKPVKGGRSGLDFVASTADLCKLSGAGQTSVESATRVLRADGYLYQVSRGGMRGTERRGNVWRLTIPTPQVAAVGEVAESSRDKGLGPDANTSQREGSNTAREKSPTLAKHAPNPRVEGYQERVSPREHHHSLPKVQTARDENATDDEPLDDRTTVVPMPDWFREKHPHGLGQVVPDDH